MPPGAAQMVIADFVSFITKFAVHCVVGFTNVLWMKDKRSWSARVLELASVVAWVI